LKNKSCPLPIKVDGIKFIFSLRFVMFLEPAYFFSFGSSTAKSQRGPFFLRQLV
jgi:hypothetical protein